LIRGGKREIDGKILYLFEDKDLELEENKTLFELKFFWNVHLTKRLIPS